MVREWSRQREAQQLSLVDVVPKIHDIQEAAESIKKKKVTSAIKTPCKVNFSRKSILNEICYRVSKSSLQIGEDCYNPQPTSDLR